MKRQSISSLLARTWLWSTRNTTDFVASSAHHPPSHSPWTDSILAQPSMRMQGYWMNKDVVFYTTWDSSVRKQRQDVFSNVASGRRGLQAYVTPQNILNLKPCVVIYDGVCHLCNAGEPVVRLETLRFLVSLSLLSIISRGLGVNWVIKADKKKRISFCALQSRAAEPYLRLCGVTREDVLRRFVFIEGPGLYHQASTAALKVATYLPFPSSALSVFAIVPVPIRDAVYDYVAKRRYGWFGKSTECILPSDDVLDRFVDKLEIQEKLAEEQSEEEEK